MAAREGRGRPRPFKGTAWLCVCAFVGHQQHQRPGGQPPLLLSAPLCCLPPTLLPPPANTPGALWKGRRPGTCRHLTFFPSPPSGRKRAPPCPPHHYHRPCDPPCPPPRAEGLPGPAAGGVGQVRRQPLQVHGRRGAAAPHLHRILLRAARLCRGQGAGAAPPWPTALAFYPTERRMPGALLCFPALQRAAPVAKWRRCSIGAVALCTASRRCHAGAPPTFSASSTAFPVAAPRLCHNSLPALPSPPCLQVPSLVEGGAFWFQDLTVADPTYMLPVRRPPLSPRPPSYAALRALQ